MRIVIRPIKFNFYRFLLILLEAFYYMPFLQGYLGAYPTIPLLALILFLSFSLTTNKFNDIIKLLITFLLLFLFRQLFLRSEVDTLAVGIYNVFNYVVSLLLPCLVLMSEKEHKKEILEFMFWIAVILLSITQITTIINISVNPNYARMMIQTDTSSELTHEISKLNIGGFAIAYSLPNFTIAVYSATKENKISKIIFIVHVILSVLFLLKVQFTLAFVIYLCVCIFLLVSFNKNNRINAFFLILILLLFVFRSQFGSWLYYFSNHIESDVISQRLKEIGQVLSGNSYQSTEDLFLRLKAYAKSIISFISHPLLGSKSIGGHSEVFDLIGRLGIFGLLIYILSHKKFYDIIVRTKSNNKYLVYFAFLLFIFISCINPVYSGTFLFSISISICFMRAI